MNDRQLKALMAAMQLSTRRAGHNVDEAVRFSCDETEALLAELDRREREAIKGGAVSEDDPDIQKDLEDAENLLGEYKEQYRMAEKERDEARADADRMRANLEAANAELSQYRMGKRLSEIPRQGELQADVAAIQIKLAEARAKVARLHEALEQLLVVAQYRGALPIGLCNQVDAALAATKEAGK